MRFFLSLPPLVLTVAACSGQPSNSEAQGFPGFQPGGTPLDPVVLTADKVVFAHDWRPVDGSLIEVILTRGSDGKYSAQKHTNLPSWGGDHAPDANAAGD